MLIAGRVAVRAIADGVVRETTARFCTEDGGTLTLPETCPPILLRVVGEASIRDSTLADDSWLAEGWKAAPRTDWEFTKVFRDTAVTAPGTCIFAKCIPFTFAWMLLTSLIRVLLTLMLVMKFRLARNHG